MPQNIPKIHFFFLLQIFIASSLQLDSIGSEREVVLELKKLWNKAPSIKAWDPAIPPCKWPGIQCTSNSITGILLSEQKISQRIPALVCNLKNLTTLDLSNNFIPGGFPVDLYNCSKLQRLNLSTNHLAGPLPSDIHRLSSLQDLDISDNDFTGEIPDAVGQLTNLTALYISCNWFSGTLPPVIGNLVNLETLDIGYNRFFDGSAIPNSYENLRKLKYLRISHCFLSCEIPGYLANFSSLEHLELTSNNLEGRIPSGLFLLKNLTRLILGANRLSGEIAKSIDALNLVEIDLSSNMLEGTAPEDFGKLQKLETLNIKRNKLSGSLPAALWKIPALKHVIVSNNNLSGVLPQELGLHSELEILDVSYNNFSGELPKDLCAQGALTSIAASSNNLRGEIPESLTKCNTLGTLSLAHNRFSGEVPFELWRLPNISTLDLSENEFTGEIPDELVHFKNVDFDLSSNKLSGRIPRALDNKKYWKGFSDNRDLCSGNLKSGLPKCFFRHQSTYLLMFLIPVLLILVILSLKLSKVKVPVTDHVKQPECHWTMTPFHSLSFTEADILSSLTEDNVIGSGGSGKVYYIHLKDSDTKVAVKRIWNNWKSSEALEKQFAAEVEILGTFRHANIVKLLCCISSESSKLLVYEYMENQSLYKWLHTREGKTYDSSSSDSMASSYSDDSPTLDWPTRLRIAIGAAKGLCYMHHSCSPSIIHRDVKSSNILLDSEFNAKIADFGLAKMVADEAGEPQTASAVAGSFGYIAPEYWRTRRLNEKIDIFSFGVVLLELVTGKEPCRGNEHLNVADWSWKHYCESRPLEDALDDTIKQQCCLQEMLEVFKLGLMCTSKDPSSRPTMKKVLQMLLLKSHQHGSDARGHNQNEEKNYTIPISFI